MPNPNKHVETYLKEYISRTDPGFAVLVSGPWGAGKTYLVKNLIKKTQKEDEKPLYVSLFGVKTSDDIDLAILMAGAPALDNGIVKLGRRIGAVALKFLPADSADFKLADFIKLELPQNMIFDDLERTNISTKELLGYLNSFVEHEGKNLILLADEDKLWKGEDRRTKEKLIGHTLTVQADIDAALAVLIQALGDGDVKKYLKRQQEVVKRVFQQSATNNLRVLGQCLWDFERLFKALDKNHRENETGMKELLSLFLALSIEYKSGGLDRNDLKQRDAGTFKDKKEEKLRKLLKAQEKYTDQNIDQGKYGSVLSTGLAISLICDGWVAPDEINKTLSQSNHFARVKEEAEWETVIRALTRKEEDVSKAVKLLERKFTAREYHDAGEVLQVFSSRLKLPEMGFLTQTLEVVEEECRNYIDDLEKAENLCGFDPTKGWGGGYGYDARSHLGHRSPSDDSPQDKAFRRLYNYMREAQDRVFEGSFPSICTELLMFMETDTDQFRVRLSTIDAIYHEHPVLKEMDVQAFVDKLLELAPISQDQIFNSLKERYYPLNEKLREECDWLRSVQQELIVRMADLSAFKRWQLKNAVDFYLTKLIQEWDEDDAKS